MWFNQPINTENYRKLADRLSSNKPPKDLMELRIEAANTINQLCSDLELKHAAFRRDTRLLNADLVEQEELVRSLTKTIADLTIELFDYKRVQHGSSNYKKDEIWRDYENKVDEVTKSYENR